MGIMKRGALMLCCLLVCACAGRMGIREECEKGIKAYNRMLRWQEVENAGMIYMEPELRDRFMSSADAMRRKGVVVTDYRMLASECLPERGTAESLAEFDYYILPSNRVKTLTYRQQWVYHEEGDAKGWRLKSGLPQFE